MFVSRKPYQHYGFLKSFMLPVYPKHGHWSSFISQLVIVLIFHLGFALYSRLYVCYITCVHEAKGCHDLPRKE